MLPRLRFGLRFAANSKLVQIQNLRFGLLPKLAAWSINACSSVREHCFARFPEPPSRFKRLFSSTQSMPQQFVQDSFAWRAEYPFQSRWLELGPYRLHYIDEGHGDPLLMVHGNPTWSFLWRHLARELRYDYRPIAVDHVGCGLSDKPRNLTYNLPVHAAHLVRLIDHVDLENATLIAHDWGGPIGLRALLSW